jgi:hypothetical protein
MNMNLNLKKMVLLAGCAALGACGGGGGGGGATESTPTQDGRITQSALHSCPTQKMSAVDMKKLQCMVGSLQGTTNTPAQAPCSVAIDTAGAVTVSQGANAHKHALSTGIGSYEPKTEKGFSEYTGRLPAKQDPSESQTAMLFEAFHFGSTNGAYADDGSQRPTSEWKDLQFVYIGMQDGSASPVNSVQVSSIFMSQPMISCQFRL